jgi:hypothetical protein
LLSLLVHKISDVALIAQKFVKLRCSKKTIQQVVDFKGLYFCIGFGQFIETRADTGLAPCQETLINKVIHISCG